MEVLVVLLCFGLSAGVIGKIKGSSFWLWFLIGLVLPGLGTLVALLYRFEQREPQRHCPECGRRLAVHVQVCPGCGRDLEFPEESLA